MTAPRRVVSLAALLFAAGLAPAQTLSPEEAIRRMKVADGFEVKIVAAEPMVRQPVSISFDDRGRVWVVQYLQYPTPAGLKPVKVDQYLRTVYDRVPEPPPKGPKGADRITILSDFDKDGRARKSKDFVSGLNLCSGMCIGHGGVYVLQVPYLLFYTDRDGDDVPDGDPEVLLSGFGMEDAHAVANSLQWGPDGWLYGAQGSTVTANVRGNEFQQGIWRYHPITKEFELFSEGGGNTWGLDFDAHGNVIAGTNWGGFAMLHQVQGAYYIKGFGKHGPLHNPHAYGYFDHVPYKDFRGGHVTCGGIVYHGGAYPAKYEGQYVAGNLLSNSLYWHVLERRGSSFTAHFGGEFLVSGDPRFRPVDCLTGPDGAVYVADWYDIRANHVDPVDNWDKTTGRIYKIVASGAASAPRAAPRGADAAPLAKRTSEELVRLLDDPNDWYHREARRILAERRDRAIVPGLKKTILAEKGPLALESLWALYVSGGFDDDFAAKLFDHPNEDVRAWTVRLLGDAKKVSPSIAARLVELARKEPSPTVRSQLACSAKRLPGKDCLPIVHELLRHKEDVSDPHIPLLLWWAVEDKAIRDRELVLGLLDTAEAWRAPLTRQHLVERLGRRYMAEGGEADYATCARLLAAAPRPDEVRLLVQGMEKALEGRRLLKVPDVLEKQLSDLWTKQSGDPLLVRFALRLGGPQGYERALAVAADPKAADADRAGLIEALGQAGKSECVPVLLRVLAEGKRDTVRGAALAALQGFIDERITPAVLDAYPKMSAALRDKALALLCSRPASALAFLQAVDAGKISEKEVPLDPLRRVAGYKDERLTKLIEKHWGKVGPLPPGEKVARINAIKHALGQKPGDPANGKLLFTKTCATCHTLFGEGNKVGPELTGADRKNRDFLLTSIVDPSAYIRPEFIAYVVNLKDGRTLTGLVAESSPSAITLLNEKNERTVLARDKIDDMAASPVSLMPEKMLDPLSEQEIRDLFAYLQKEPSPDRVAAALQPFVDDHALAGAVTLAADKDKVLSLEAVGYADVTAKKPMKTDALFWIASQSKSITAAAFMMLVDDGKVKLDDPVEKYLPEFKGQWLAVEQDKDHALLKHPKHPITIREILSHTSGLPFKSAMEFPTLDVLSLRDAARSYAMTPLLFEPGTKSAYSNAGINTAGRIIEVVGGMPYEDFLDKRLLGPLGMKDTTFWPSEEQLKRLAKSYRPNKDKTDLEETTIVQLQYPLSDRRRQPMPGGGLFSTAADLGRFCRMVLNGGTLDGKRYLSEAAVKEMTTKQTGEMVKDQYGLGWFTGGGRPGHGGAYSTNMTIDPKTGIVMVYMVQHADFPKDGRKSLEAFQKAAEEQFGKR